MANSVELSTFDVYTASYFLSGQTLKSMRMWVMMACLEWNRTCVSYDVTLKR